MKYRVFATVIENPYVDVEAESPEEAMEKAEEMDGGDFNPDPHGDWQITSARPLTTE